MGSLIAGLLIGAVLVLLVTALLARRQRQVEMRELPPEAGTQEGSWYGHSLLERLYRLQSRVCSVPLPATPEALLWVAPFSQLVETLSVPTVDNESLLGYVRGDDLVLQAYPQSALAASANLVTRR